MTKEKRQLFEVFNELNFMLLKDNDALFLAINDRLVSERKRNPYCVSSDYYKDLLRMLDLLNEIDSLKK